MDTAQLIRQSACEWWIAPFGKMRVPAVIFASETLIREMDQKGNGSRSVDPAAHVMRIVRVAIIGGAKGDDRFEFRRTAVSSSSR